MSYPKPVFFLIHGAWMGSNSYAPVINSLWSAGYPTWCQELPFHNGDPESDANETVQFIRRELLKIFEAGRDVIAVCWSFGAVMGPASFDGMWKEERKKQGQDHGIVGMVMACGPPARRIGITATENGKDWDNHTWFGGGSPMEVFNLGPLITIKTDKDSPFARAMYATLPSAPDPNNIFDSLLRPLSAKAHNTPLPYAPGAIVSEDESGAWQVPTAYFLAEQDTVIPTAVQEKVVSHWQGKWKKVYRFDCGHVIWVAKPQEVVRDLIDFAKSIEV